MTSEKSTKIFATVLQAVRMKHGLTTDFVFEQVRDELPIYITVRSLEDFEGNMTPPEISQEIMRGVRPYLRGLVNLDALLTVLGASDEHPVRRYKVQQKGLPGQHVNDSPLKKGDMLSEQERLQAEDWFRGFGENEIVEARVSLGERQGTSGNRLLEQRHEDGGCGGCEGSCTD
ncbi:hypothetical protein L596_001295 [Steinernema carpocapsae]|uniref:Uncharacterized protein n=1 Tax=Steinernema carpocapsae TaxID=34508 RepID=A0A4U8ULD1_STECR|nr:hypothetical protein L596_001295 [Steinernema carpocapsae]